MKKRFLSILMALNMILVLLPVNVFATVSTSGTIQGTVVDAETQKPVSATVTLYAKGNSVSPLASATADASTGTYMIAPKGGITAGQYTLVFTSSLYLSHSLDIEVTSNDGLLIAAATGLYPVGRCDGKVTDSKSGAALSGVAVNVYTTEGSLNISTTTGADGKYSIETQAGIYNVEFVKNGYTTARLERISLGAIATTHNAQMTNNFGEDGKFVASGSCGDNLTWTIDANGILTISGVGPMIDFTNFSNTPWYSFSQKIQSVVIGDSVTSIGSNAFNVFHFRCNLNNVIIGESVTRIGNSAFYGCENLTNIIIPDGVTAIGSEAFAFCNLTHATIGKGVTHLESRVFYNCDQLTDISIPNTITSIDADAFRECSSLTHFVISNGVTSIGDRAFFGCSALTSVTIPDSVTSIGNSAFSKCSKLAQITIPNGVETIGTSAFAECSMLSRVVIPDSVISIGEYAFLNCDSLTNAIILGRITCIDRYVFEHCGSLLFVSIPSNVTEIRDYAFWGCENLTDIYYADSKNKWEAIAVGHSNNPLASAIIHYNSANSETSKNPNNSTEMKSGTLQAVSANTVVVDGTSYQVPEGFAGAMSTLLNDKNITDNLVVFELVDGTIKSIYSIYDVIVPSISLEKNIDAIIFQSKKSSVSEFNLTAKISAVSGGIYTESQLRTLNGLSLSFKEINLKSFDDALYFGKNLGILKDKDQKFDLGSVTLAYGDSQTLNYTVYVDGGNMPSKVSSDARIRAEITLLGGGKSWENNIFIPLGNLDLQAQKAEQQTGTNNLATSASDLRKELDKCTAISLDAYLGKYFTTTQIQSIEDFLTIYIAEAINADRAESANLFEQLSNKVRKEAISKIFSKLGISKSDYVTVDKYKSSVKVEGAAKSGKTVTVNFDIVMDVYALNGNTFSGLCTINYQVLGTSDKGNGVMTYADMESFSDIMLNYIKTAYNKAWGNTANKVAEMFVQEPINKLLQSQGTYSNQLFKLITKPATSAAKKVSVRCPVDVYIYNRAGELCAEISNNTVNLTYQDVFCYVEGDEKNIYLIGNDYSMKLVGNDVGTMEYVIEEYLDGELVRTVITKNIPLSNGKTYTAFVPEIAFIDHDVYALSTDTDQMIDIDTDTYKSGSPNNPFSENNNGTSGPSNDTTTQPIQSAGGFADVALGEYYSDAVAWAVAKGITNGTTATTFGPKAFCTRAQMVTFLWRAAGSPTPTNAQNPFSDVAEGTYYYDAVLWAAEKNITVGTSMTTFGPDTTVTRGQTVTFLYRAAGSPAGNSSNPFTDTDNKAYYYSAVLWAIENGVTTGTSATTFSPDDNCTRAQIVTFLYRNRAS